MSDINDYTKIFTYTPSSSSNTKQYIEQDKPIPRICRFCNKTEPEVEFREQAHAISEFLGNKKLFLYEECDTCNSLFSRYENQLAIWQQTFQIMSATRGKRGVPKITNPTKDIKFKHNPDRSSRILEIQNLESDAEFYKEELKGNQLSYRVLLRKAPIIDQFLYRTLVKYVLSCIDKETLLKFNDTLEWLQGRVYCGKLPKLLIETTILQGEEFPQLHIYERKNCADTNLPIMIGELVIPFVTIFFVIPQCNKQDEAISQDVLVTKIFPNKYNERDWSCAIPKIKPFELKFSGKDLSQTTSKKLADKNNTTVKSIKIEIKEDFQWDMECFLNNGSTHLRSIKVEFDGVRETKS